MNAEDFAKDFGIMVASQNPNAEHVFLPFPMYHLVVMSEGSYTTTSNVTHHDGEDYAVTLDFDQKIFNQIIRLLPKNIGLPLQDAVEDKVRPMTKIDFPSPLNLFVETKLGKPTGNQYEDFIPFVVTNVRDAGPA